MVLDLMEKDSFFLHPSDETGKNPINFEVDINLSTRIDSRKKYILILGKSYTQGLQHSLSPEKMCSSNFTEHNIKELFELALW